MPPREPFRALGVVYDLSHLEPFVFLVTPKADGAPNYRVLATFGHHTFCRHCEPRDDAAFLYEEHGDARSFCPVRYEQSLALPRIIRFAASGGKAYFSQRDNFLLIDNLPGLAAPYVVLFNVKRSRQNTIDCNMFVSSAYEKPGLPPLQHLRRISFATLIATVAQGRPVKRPK
jgi:hypothetical protein